MPTNPQSFKVTSTLAAYRIVAMVTGTANTVQYHATVASLPIGVTTDNVTDTTVGIPVAGPGEIKQVYFNDTVTSEGLVTGDSSGRGVPFTAVTAPTAFVGKLIGPSVAATGTIADVYIMPGFKAIP